MLLIAGLGNPGPTYAGNRHNIGFMAVDEIHRDPSFSPWSQKFKGLFSEGRLGNDKVFLLKPQTFMNLSGESVAAAASFFKIAPEDIVVLHDELDIPPGKVRIKTGGGNGGHNGLRSIDAHLGPNYKRVRLGIGHPGNKELVSPYVLGNFAKADQSWLEPLLEAVARNSDLLVARDDARFMNRIAMAGGSDEPASAKGREPGKGQSHIRQARVAQNSPKPPVSGPMADMLKRLFGKD
ncbi:aminoacyl-tRNA hydrolase [Aureimonas fodinaquatilis]|uniref:Peptidyl-tRNA hydrolase n=1 Tax=Aureimonas fodinaquatilis TaxID=2565783 RepID=A0A5B0DZ14_9HYPH|nr:aminoacyl-tRNA hydrolase [Aureimonas fodinaquatilis]KAA0971773.1 aminoacyl-tRNA hydrolase [Aureimonas fodinaquatilis]